ncbi:zinc finger, CCHC-type containing protein [Tanacetum coccineum]
MSYRLRCAYEPSKSSTLQRISAFVDSHLENIERFLNNFANDTNMNDLESNDESVDTPLVSPFSYSNNDSDNGEVLNELIEYENVGMKFTAYFNPFLPMNIIMRKAYNTIMVEGLESTRKNLVAVVSDVYVFVGSFTYITDFVVLEDIGEFIQVNMVEVEEKSDIYDVETDDDSKGTEKPDMEVAVKEVKTMNEAENEAENMPIKKVKGNTYNVSPRGPIYEAILKKKITKKEDIGGNFELPCGIGGLKHVNALVDQGSDINIMTYSTYVKLTNERLAKTDIKLSLASHSYIYPLGIAEDVLVEVAEHVYPMDFMILDIKEDERRPFILGTSFLTTAKAMIKFDKGTITLRSGKSKISFHRIPEYPDTIERGVKNDKEPLSPTMTVNRLVLEWEERIKLHLEKEIEFNQWRSKNFKSKHPSLLKVEGGMDDEGEVT